MALERTQARRAAGDHWSAHPAGTELADAEKFSTDFFAQMTESRYRVQPWHPPLLEEFSPKGRLLEVGCGAGTDHAVLASMATSTVGIDLAHQGARLTATRLRLDGRSGSAMVADGEAMPFQSDAFDVAYSFGVIHHTDHPDRVVQELHRVLAPGAQFLVGLYHRHSLSAGELIMRYILKGYFRHEPWQRYLGQVEFGAMEERQRPVVRLYSRRSARKLFTDAGFQDIRITTRHTTWRGRLFNSRWLKPFGWYVVVTGRVPAEDPTG